MMKALQALERRATSLYRGIAPGGNYGANVEGSDNNESTFADLDEVIVQAREALRVQPMNTAPKNGTMIRLAVDYTNGNGNLDDDHHSWTIGFNNFDNSEEDVWQMAGWDWCQDEFTKGCGEPFGWLPWDNPDIRKKDTSK